MTLFESQQLSVHPRFFSHLFHRSLSVLVFLCSVQTVLASEILVLEDNEQLYNLHPKLEIADPEMYDASGLKQWERLTFSPLAESSVVIEDRQWYYLRFQVENRVSVQDAVYDWVLKSPLVLTEVEYLVVKEDETWQSGRTGFFVPLAQRDFVPLSKFGHLLAQGQRFGYCGLLLVLYA